MIRQILKDSLEQALKAAGHPEIDPQIFPTTDQRFGDYYSTAALKLAKLQGSKDFLESAKFLVGKISKNEKIFLVGTAANGFINFTIQPQFLQQQVQKIIEENESYGRVESGKGKKARVEFVSANPTGPLHIGNARGGPLGDTITSVLEFAGYKVLREYINNDRGNQVKELGWTVASKAELVKKRGEMAYESIYTDELAEKVKGQIGEIKNLNEEDIAEKAGEISVKLLHQDIIKDLEGMGIKYDLIVHESELQKGLPAILTELDKMGVLKKHEGAVWFVSKDNQEGFKDKGWVVVKSDGSYTYFAADIVYHKEKFQSGYDLVVDVFGSNTYGHVPKLKALTSLFQFDINNFKVILYQFVRVRRGKEVIRMSKRAGNFVTAKEVFDEVGKDALRFFLLMHDPSTHMDFDLDLAKKKSNENPVYYIQYAHARANSLLKKAQEEGLQPEKSGKPDFSLLKTASEMDLVKKLIRLPELIEDITSNLSIHLLANYALEVSDLFHKFYESERVVDKDQPNLSQARLGLVNSTKIVLHNGLKLMGISAPDRMEKIDDKA